jgi:hypothetical protein
MRALIWLALAPALLLAEERWTTPVLGAVFDSAAKTVRPVIGVQGAASLTDAVAIPWKIERAFVSPDESSAIVTGAEGTAVVSWTRSAVTFARLENALEPVGASWSGRDIAIYDADGNVQVWRDGELRQSHRIEPASVVSLCDSGRVVLGVCGPDGDYSLDESGVIRTREGKRELVAEGAFAAIASYKGVVAAAGGELLVLANGEQQRIALRANAVSVQPMRTPGVFVLGLDDGSKWIYGDGELQLLEGGRQ